MTTTPDTTTPDTTTPDTTTTAAGTNADDSTTLEQPARRSRRPLGVLGMGAAACAACCAGPIVAFLAAAGVFTAAGVALFGVVGLVVLVPAAAWAVRRRRRAAACAASPATVPVTLAGRAEPAHPAPHHPRRDRTASIDARG